MNIFNNKYMSDLPMTKEDTNDNESDATLRPVGASIEAIQFMQSPKTQKQVQNMTRNFAETLEMTKGIIHGTSESNAAMEILNQNSSIENTNKSLEDLKSIRNKSVTLQN
jgi:hypothetical protein